MPAGCRVMLKWNVALDQEGRNGIMRFFVPHLVCVEVMWVCTAEQKQ